MNEIPSAFLRIERLFEKSLIGGRMGDTIENRPRGITRHYEE